MINGIEDVSEHVLLALTNANECVLKHPLSCYYSLSRQRI